MMETKFSYVSERDIDLLIMQELTNPGLFLLFVLNKVNIKSFNEIYSISHSVMHPTLGESDIVMILNADKHKHAIFIENKIDADAMENQYQRYVLRAEEGIKKGDFQEYSIFIMAPKKYLETNLEASKYPHKISYEEILEYIDKNPTHGLLIKTKLLEMAINKQESGYIPLPDEKVTLFWQQYYSYKNQHFPHLILNEVEGPRGSRARWPWFKTHSKSMAIAHKSDRGFVDLTLYGKAEDLSVIEERISNLLDADMTLVKTNKSSSIRLLITKIDFETDFESQILQVKEALDAVSRLFLLSKKIDI